MRFRAAALAVFVAVPARGQTEAPASVPASASGAAQAPASASGPAQAPAPASGPAPAPTTLDQAKAQGYAPRPTDEPAGSLLGGLLAVGPGFLVHGVGHYYVDETSTAWKLLIGEVLGVALVGAGAILQATTDDSGALGPVRQTLVHSGLFLFLGTWITDILGTFKGAQSFEPDSTRTEGRVLSLAYRYRSDPREPLRHHLVGGLDLDFGRVYVRPGAMLEVGLDERDYRLDTGVRLWRGDNRQNQVAAGVKLRRLEVPAFGYATRSGEIYARWKADLGQTIRSMRGFYLTNRLGLGMEQYQFSTRLDDAPALTGAYDTQAPFFTLASGAEVNTGRHTHVGLMFIQDPTADVVAASHETGVLEVFLNHRYREDLEIQVDLLAGDGWAIWLGLGYGL